MESKANNTSNEYLKTKVMTAPPEQLQLMLYDAFASKLERPFRLKKSKKAITCSIRLKRSLWKCAILCVMNTHPKLVPECVAYTSIVTGSLSRPI